MRHYVAVQDENGRWFYANEGRHRVTGQHGWSPAGACSPRISCPDCHQHWYGSEEQRACKTCEGTGLVMSPTPCTGHDTAHEAYGHERQRKLQNIRFCDDREDARSLERCEAEGCKNYTSGSAHVGRWFTKSLCAEHRTHEVVETMFHVGESWES